MQPDRASSETDPAPSRTAYVAELQCFLCGNYAGAFETDRKPLPPYGIWRPAVSGEPQRIADWRQLHCSRCGGGLFAESVDTVSVPNEGDALRREAPRRGRPPKWLVEQRRRERAAAESRCT